MFSLREIVYGRPGPSKGGCRALRPRGLAIVAGLLATIASSLSVYPHQLAYFNEASGGPESGHKHLLGSNIEWGQDLLFLNSWVQGHPAAGPVLVSVAGRVDLLELGIEHDHRPIAESLVYFAVGANELQKRGVLSPIARSKYCEDQLSHRLRKATCVHRAGHSIYVFMDFTHSGVQVGGGALECENRERIKGR